MGMTETVERKTLGRDERLEADRLIKQLISPTSDFFDAAVARKLINLIPSEMATWQAVRHHDVGEFSVFHKVTNFSGATSASDKVFAGEINIRHMATREGEDESGSEWRLDYSPSCDNAMQLKVLKIRFANIAGFAAFKKDYVPFKKPSSAQYSVRYSLPILLGNATLLNGLARINKPKGHVFQAF